MQSKFGIKKWGDYLGIPVASSIVVTIGALTLGKSVVIADALLFVNRYPDKPLAYNVIRKTFI